MSTIAWLIPSLLEGSGGHRTILQNAEFLSRNGFKTTLYLERRRRSNVGETPAQTIERLYGCRFDDVRVGWDRIGKADLTVATIWHSAAVVARLTHATHGLYFVQDWEPMFFAMGDDALRAERSYQLGLTPITIGRWLQIQLQRQGSLPGGYFDFCADLSTYRPLPQSAREDAIAFICQPEKPRRAAMLGLEALAIVKALRPQTRIYLYGSVDALQWSVEHRSLGLIGVSDCNALYNLCSVGLCLSTSNPSRIPFEMMASGLPVVELHRDNTVYDLPAGACLLCEPEPAAIAEALLQRLEYPKERELARAAALAFMASRDIAGGMQQLLCVMQGVAGGEPADSQPIDPFYAAPPVRASERTRAVLRTPAWQAQSRLLRARRKKRFKLGRQLKTIMAVVKSRFAVRGRAPRSPSGTR